MPIPGKYADLSDEFDDGSFDDVEEDGPGSIDGIEDFEFNSRAPLTPQRSVRRLGMVLIGSERELPPGSKVEGRYGNKIVAIVPDVNPATVPGSVAHSIRPRFFDLPIMVRRVYCLKGGR